MAARSGDTTGIRRVLSSLAGWSAARGDAEPPGDTLFRAFAASAPAAVFLHRGGEIVYSNPAADALTGRALRETPGSDYFSLLHPDFRDAVRLRDAARKPESPPSRHEVRFLRAHDDDRWVDLTAVTVNFAGGPVVLAIGFDVSDRKLAEGAHREAERRVRDLFESVRLIAVLRDADGVVTFANEFLLELLGIPEDEVVGHDWFSSFVPVEEQETQRAAFIHAVGSATVLPYEESEIVLTRLEEKRLISWNHTLLHDLQERVVGLASIGADITERKRVEKQLIHDAFHDSLTGLPNRALLMDRLSGAMARAKRRPGALVALLFLDVDRFKFVNDSLGHAFGDQLLLQLGRLLSSVVRPGDTVARLGGDEFTLLLEDVEEPPDAVRVAERIRESLATPFRLGGQDVFATASIGIAISTRAYARPEDLLRDADTAMYQAKAGGKARHQVFDTSMHNRAVEVLALEHELRRAVELKSFLLHYQPIVELSTGRIAGVEALARWEHSQRGLVPPSEFIPMAEETGLILEIGHWALRECCRAAKEWVTTLGRDLTAAVNLSGKQFSRADLVDQVKDALAETGLPPHLLKLEITESVIMENAEAAIEMLEGLRRLGVGVSIDDFGTGYSSLAYLLRLPADTLKLDRSFVVAMGKADRNAKIVSGILELGRGLGMDVVAEGVETEAQRAQLSAMGCRFAQGYLFSRPIDNDRMGQLLAGTLRGPGLLAGS